MKNESTIQIFIKNPEEYNPEKVSDLVSGFVKGKYNPSRTVLKVKDNKRIYSPIERGPCGQSLPPFIHVYIDPKDSVIIEVKDRERGGLGICEDEELKDVAKGLLKIINENNFEAHSPTEF
jgi:hypothetical protein